MTENRNPYTGPPQGPQHGPQPGFQQGPQPSDSSEDKFFNSIRQSGFFRSEERWVAGVAGGVARKFGLDPLLVRGLFAASLLFFGAGLVLYGIAWALLPEERDGRIHVQEMIRGNFDGALIGAGIAIFAGFPLGSGFGWNGLNFLPFGFGGWFNGVLWFAATAGVIAVVVVTINKQRADASQSTTSPSQAPHAEQDPYTVPHTNTPAGDGEQRSAASTQPLPPQATQDQAAQAYSPPTQTPQFQTSQPQPPRPPKVHGPGAALVGAVLGLWALVSAGVLIADRLGQLSVPVTVLIVAALIGLCGLGIIVAGMRGRASGTFGAIAIISLIVALPLVAWSGDDLKISDATRGGIGEAVFVPASVAEAEKGYAVLIGDWELDLTSLPPTTDPINIPVTLAAGELIVRMPPESDWSAQVALGAGEVRVQAPENSTTRSGVLIGNHKLSSQTVLDGATADYDLTIRGAAGQIIIIEETL